MLDRLEQRQPPKSCQGYVVLAVLAPGQGAQQPGMLTPWLDVPTSRGTVRDRMQWWSTVVGIDLLAAGTTATDDALRDTAIAQPLLVATGLATMAAVHG